MLPFIVVSSIPGNRVLYLASLGNVVLFEFILGMASCAVLC